MTFMSYLLIKTFPLRINSHGKISKNDGKINNLVNFFTSENNAIYKNIKCAPVFE